jgi:hypothetical protein
MTNENPNAGRKVIDGFVYVDGVQQLNKDGSPKRTAGRRKGSKNVLKEKLRVIADEASEGQQ